MAAALIQFHVIRWDDGTPTQDKGRFQEMKLMLSERNVRRYHSALQAEQLV